MSKLSRDSLDVNLFPEIQSDASGPRRLVRDLAARLSLITTFKPPDVAEFAVADSGAGIDPEIRDRLFEPFVTTKRNGMGIGLAVSRSIIERRGGRPRFDPNPGGGTIFSFTLTAALSDGDFDAG